MLGVELEFLRPCRLLCSALLRSAVREHRSGRPLRYLKILEIYFSCAAPSPSRPISSSSRATRASVPNKAEAKPALSLPTPPPELSDDAKVEWGRVSEEPYRVGLLSKIDRASLAAYCRPTADGCMPCFPGQERPGFDCTRLYDRRAEGVSLDDVERVVI
jgi:hypothetical protein